MNSSTSTSHFNSFLSWIAGGIALSFACLVGLFHIHNADVWWHIAWGEKMLQLHTLVPPAEDFYFTPVDPAYRQQLTNTFLGDVGLALLYRLGGVFGLQLLVLLCLVIAGVSLLFFPLRSRLRQENNWCWEGLLLFFLLALGTSQLQMVRNALFSLAFFPLTLALFYWHTHDKNGWKVLFLYPLLFLIWSMVHSSYALGIIALFLLYTGLLIDRFLKRPCLLSTGPIVVMLMAPCLLLLLSLIYSSQIRVLLAGSFFHGITLLFQTLHLDASSASSFLIENNLRPSWEKNGVPLSGDFLPTWKVFFHPAAWASLLLMLIAFSLLGYARPRNQFGMLALLGLTTYFGVNYLRGIGYGAIAALFVIASILAEADQKKLRRGLKKAMSFSCALLCGIALVGMGTLVHFNKNELFFREKERVFGFGKAAIFDDAPYAFVKSHFLQEPCFTTIVTGSYASFCWDAQKKVFIDGFFAPHPIPLWEDYRAATLLPDLSFLDAYGIQVALIENNRSDWQYAFLSDIAWRPVAIGIGATVYAKTTLIADSPVSFLFTAPEVERLASPTSQRAAAVAYYNALLLLASRGMQAAADLSISQSEDLFETLAYYLEPSEQENIRQQPRSLRPILLSP